MTEITFPEVGSVWISKNTREKIRILRIDIKKYYQVITSRGRIHIDNFYLNYTKF